MAEVEEEDEEDEFLEFQLIVNIIITGKTTITKYILLTVLNIRLSCKTDLKRFLQLHSIIV